MTSANTGNRTGDTSVGHSQDGEATGSNHCSEQRKSLKDDGTVLQRICSEDLGVGQGCPRESSLRPFFTAVGLGLLLAGATPAHADVQPPKQVVSAGRMVTPPSGQQAVRGKAMGLPRFQRPQDVPPTPEQLAAARGFEAMMIDHLIQEMRKSVPDNELMPASQGEKIFRQMLDTEYARKLSESGGIGIAGLVLEQLQGKR